VSTKTEVENIKTSGAEKVLAGVLAIFILIGGVWLYGQIGKISEDTYRDDYGGTIFRPVDLSPADRAALRESNQASRDLWRANSRVRRAKSQVEFTGDAYRTEIDAGLPGTVQLATYRDAQQNLEDARLDVKVARSEVRDAKPAADEARANQRKDIRDSRASQRSDDRWVALFRILLVAAMLGGGILGLSLCRRRRSRLTPLALADIVAGSLLAAWMAIDYGTSLGVFREMGPLAISLIGILLTTIAFIALQRYLAKKIPSRRVRRRECPFCGYPARGNQHCEGCGRTVLGECTTCHQPRRISTAHCGSCGAA